MGWSFVFSENRHTGKYPTSKLFTYGERSEPRENARERDTPRTGVSFRVLLSRDFSRLPQMESMLAGYLESFILLFFSLEAFARLQGKWNPLPIAKW